MSTEHKNITDVDLHETKGAAGAAANTVHIASGSGSTSWDKIGPANISTTTIKNVNLIVLSLVVPSLTATFTTYLPVPMACKLVGVVGTVDATPSNNLSIGVLNGATSLATMSFPNSGSPPLRSEPTVSGTGNTFATGAWVTISNTGAVSTTGKLTIVFTFDLS